MANRSITLSTAALAAWPLALAMVSTGAQADQAQGDTGVTLEQIVVTASKRKELSSEVPASVSVFDSAELQALHATSLEDLASYAPGLVISNGGSPGQSMIILRGLNTEANGPLVATLIDDSGVGSSTGWVREDAYQLDLMPYDIERIEILRGPQGTLYGANSMGGVLKYVTRNPDLNELRVQAGADAFGVENGSSAGYAVRGALSGPLLTGHLALSLSAYDRRTPGYIDDPQEGVSGDNGLTQRGGRVALYWKPDDALTVKLQDLYQQILSQGNATAEAQVLGTTTPYHVGWWLGPYDHLLAEPFDQATNFTSLEVNWALGFADLVSATSYSNKHLTQRTDASNNIGFLIPLLDPQTTSTTARFDLMVGTTRVTQELRLTSTSTGRLQWMIGLYYDSEKGSNHQVLDAFDTDLTLIPALTPFEDFSAPTTYKETAGFANATLRITRGFDVTAGIRQSHNSQTNTQNYGGFLLSPPSTIYATASQNVTQYSVSPRYHLSPDTMMYLRLATGYRPGAPNDAIPGYPNIPTQTNADRITNVEGGIKSQFLDRRAAVDLSVYHIRWTDLQSNAYTPDGNFSYSVNAGSASSQGFELSAYYRPLDRLQLSANAAYTDAKLTQTVEAVGAVDGARLPTAPRWTASGIVNYRFANFRDWEPRLNAAVRYVDAQYNTVSTFNSAAILPPYTLADLNLSFSNGPWQVSLYADNVADRRAFSSAKVQNDQRFGTTYFFGTIVPPRTIGISLDVSY